MNLVFDKFREILFDRYVSTILFIFKLVNVFKQKKQIPPPNDELVLISARKAAEMIRTRKIRSSDLMGSYVRRARELKPFINAIAIENFEEALGKSQRIDEMLDGMSEEEREQFCSTRPLLGIPFTVKNNMPVKGKGNSGGFWYFRDAVAEESAEIVKLMERSGAILFAITNVPPLACWFETSNILFGRTDNPYDTRRTPGGSSGGECALMSSAGGLIGVGTDLAGSIRWACMFTGIFGLKTTPLAVTHNGFNPPKEGFQKCMSNIGPICRFAEDLELVFNVLSQNKPGRLIPLKKMRLLAMYPPSVWGIQKPSRDMVEAFQRSLSFLETLLNSPTRFVSFPGFRDSRDIFLSCWQVAPLTQMDIRIANAQGKLNLKFELFRMLLGVPRHSLGSVGTLLATGKSKRMSEETKEKFRHQMKLLREEVLQTMGNNSILVTMGGPTVAPFHHQMLFIPCNAFYYHGIWNCLGLPSVACPAGFDKNGMALGVQIIGRPGTDHQLIRIAREMERKFCRWEAPWEDVHTRTMKRTLTMKRTI